MQLPAVRYAKIPIGTLAIVKNRNDRNFRTASVFPLTEAAPHPEKYQDFRFHRLQLDHPSQ
jgi:hypothetical protein